MYSTGSIAPGTIRPVMTASVPSAIGNPSSVVLFSSTANPSARRYSTYIARSSESVWTKSRDIREFL
jgi:hypothetical protein